MSIFRKVRSTARARPTRSIPTISCSSPTNTPTWSSPIATDRRSASAISAAPSARGENELIAGWYNQQRAIILAIQRQPGANVIETVDRIKAMLPVLQASIPPAVKINVISDRTQTIRASVADVQFTLLLTVALVVMVIFIFLRNFWATIIPAVTVPLSLIGTFAVLYELGYSLDNLSLMALSIAVGFVVDDAVVEIENIVRHMEEGVSPYEAALKGSGEIGFTVMAITFSLIAVFIPLFLMSGYVGLLFREFAVTVSVALVLSLMISRTLTPMMCAYLLKPESKEHGWLYRLSERGFDGLLYAYEAGLKDRAAAPLHHADGDVRHHRADRVSLRGHSQGLLSPAGHRIDHRPVRGGAGYFLPGHGGAPASFARRPHAGSGRRHGRFGGRRRRRQQHAQRRPRIHCAQAPGPARPRSTR